MTLWRCEEWEALAATVKSPVPGQEQSVVDVEAGLWSDAQARARFRAHHVNAGTGELVSSYRLEATTP